MGTSKNMKSTKNSVYKSFRLYGASNNKDQGKLAYSLTQPTHLYLATYSYCNPPC